VNERSPAGAAVRGARPRCGGAGPVLGLSALCALAIGCAVDVPGTPPPLDQLYFPLGLAVVPGAAGRDVLVVASSDFDQRYNAGTLIALDVAALSQLAPPADEPVFRDDFGPAIVDALRVPSLSGELVFAPEGAGRGALLLSVRAAGQLALIEVSGGQLDCATGPGGEALTPAAPSDCSAGHLSPTGFTDAFAVATATVAGGDVAVAVGSLQTVTEADPGTFALGRLSSLRARVAAEAAGQALPSPLVRTSGGDVSGLSGLAFASVAGAASPELFSVALGDRSTLAMTRFALTGLDGASLGLSRESALRLDAVARASRSRGLVIAPALTATVAGELRAYVSLRFPESTTSNNAGIGVVRIEQGAMNLLRVFEVGQELGKPVLLERAGRRLLYVPDLRTDEVHVLDVTTDAPVLLASLGGTTPRQTAEGLVQARHFDAPAGIAFADVGGRTLGFVSNFANGTLAVIDASAADPRQHRVVARLGRTLDALGQPEQP
jgi:hypothetical protein